MEWKYVKPLISDSVIDEFEKTIKYSFPDDFKDCVVKNNGGRPQLKIFDTSVCKERAIKSLLSFNKDDKVTIWKINEWNAKELTNRFIAFAIDNFGNLICFDSNDNSVIFMDMETLKVELIANSFTGFLNCLYE